MADAGATKTPRAAPTDRDAMDAWFREQGLSPRWWGNPPGDTYGRHAHEYHKVLLCAEGSITFHTPGGDVALAPGDRLDLKPGTEHGATVGPRGVTCVEAPVEP